MHKTSLLFFVVVVLFLLFLLFLLLENSEGLVLGIAEFLQEEEEGS